MKRILFKESLAQIKKSVSMLDVLKEYKYPASSDFIPCMLHSGDNTPSFHLYAPASEQSSFCCFGCNVGGDILTFVEHIEGIVGQRFKALEILSTRFSIPLIYADSTNGLLERIKTIIKAPADKSKKIISERVQKELYDLVASDAGRRVEQLFSNNDQTPYTIAKRVRTPYAHSDGDLLIVPLRNVNNNIRSYQTVFPNGIKQYLANSDPEGCFLRLWDDSPINNIAFLCEGYATGASIFMALRMPVFCCMRSSNIIKVYKELIVKYPECRFVVAGDNDEPGHKHGLFGIYPKEKDMDWNDVHVAYDLCRVKHDILEALGIKDA